MTRDGTNAPRVELYHFWSSVCSVRCRMALNEKAVQWESRYVDLFRFDQLTPAYLAINPDGVVPTLVYDGHVIREATIIAEFIDQAFAGIELVPGDPVRAAEMRLFVHAADEALKPIALLTYVKYILPKLRLRWNDDELRKQASRRPTKFLRDLHSRGIQGEISDEELRQAQSDIETLLDEIETRLHDGPWLVGAYSLADITLAPYMFRLSALGQRRFWSQDKRPRLHDWYARLSARPAFQAAVSWPDESGGGYREVGLGADDAAERT